MITIKPIEPGTRLRLGHNTAAAVITSYGPADTLQGLYTWTAPEDLKNDQGAYINKLGDVWLSVTHVNGKQLPQAGWTAITHAGLPICTEIGDMPAPTPPPRPVRAVIYFDDNSTLELFPYD